MQEGSSVLSFVILSVAFGTTISTLLGGVAALRFRDKLHIIMGFSAGAVIALAFFDLLPEALRLDGHPPQSILAITGAGFFAYAFLDRLLLLHGEEAREVTQRGWAGAVSLSAHSFVDGLALGIGFQASIGIGIVVAAAILAHDCADGMNTVSIVLKNGGNRNQAFGWLIADALAPLAGAVSSLFLHPAESQLTPILAAFAGFFLYIGASDLLPESFRAGSRFVVVTAMIAGATMLYVVARFAG